MRNHSDITKNRWKVKTKNDQEDRSHEKKLTKTFKISPNHVAHQYFNKMNELKSDTAL